MKYFKKTFLWIIALVVLIGYNWLEVENDRIETVAKEEATRLFPFDAIEVLSITLRKEGQILDLERWEDGWRIISPVKAPADSEAVDKFLSYVLDSRNDAEYVMDSDPTEERLAEFGLKDPVNSVTLRVGRDLSEHTLYFGDRAPSMGVAFARVKGQKEVYRVLAQSRAEADKDIYYFRNKKALKDLDPLKVDKVAIRRNKTHILLKLPDSGKWTVEKKTSEVVADNARVFEFLAAFTNAEIKEFAAESQENLGQYGLNNPMAELNFWMAGKPKPAINLSIGKRDPKKRGYYCTVTGHNGIIILPEEVINALPRSGNDLRNREIFTFEPSDINRIEIHTASKDHMFVRDNDKEWHRNNESGELIDFQKVKEFIDEVIALRIDDFLSDPGDFGKLGLDPPLMQVTLWQETSATPMSLVVGHAEPSGGRVYARTNDKEVLLVDKRVERVLTTYF